MPQIDIDGANSKISADKIQGQSGTNVELQTGHKITQFTSTGIDDNADATAITIDSSENVGIGTTSPECKAHFMKASSGGATDGSAVCHLENSGSALLQITAGTSNTAGIAFGDSGNSNIGSVYYDNSVNAMTFRADNGEKMRIDSSGKMFIGCTTAPSTSVVGLQLSPSITAVNPHISSSGSQTTSTTHFEFKNGNGTVGSITTSGTSTAFNTSSDYRLKENLVPMEGAIDRLNQLKPYRFNFISDPNKVVDGFIAHEAQEVVPESVSGTKDEMEEYEVTPEEKDEDGNVIKEAVMGTREKMQGIDQAKIVPLLVGALQEAIGRIETLEQEVAVLKGDN